MGDVFWLAARFGDHVASIPSCTLCYQHGGEAYRKVRNHGVVSLLLSPKKKGLGKRRQTLGYSMCFLPAAFSWRSGDKSSRGVQGRVGG